MRPNSTVRGEPRENLLTLDEGATLNDALDTMLTAAHSKVIVTGDRDRYLGVLDFESVTEHMRQAEQDAAERAEQDAAERVEQIRQDEAESDG
jgi:osmoprotectant transport system ATP-binding protein